MRAAGNVAAMRRPIVPTAWSPWGSYDVGQREGGDSDQDCTLGYCMEKKLETKKWKSLLAMLFCY